MPGAHHRVADAPDQRLDARGAEHRVVDVVLVGRVEVAVALAPGLLVAVLEDDELELGAGRGRPAALGQPRELAAQDLARRGHHVASRPPRRGRPSAAPCPRATGSAAACPCRASSRSRRSRAPSSTSRSRRRCSCPRRRRAGSCSPRRRARPPRRGSGRRSGACPEGGPPCRRCRAARCRCVPSSTAFASSSRVIVASLTGVRSVRPTLAALCSGSTRGRPASRRRCSTSGCARCARRGATRSTATRSRAGSSRTARRCSPPWSRRWPSCSRTRRDEVVACGLDHQGESVLAWDAETGTPLTPDRRLAGQALAGGARPAGRRTRTRSASCSGLPVRPLLLRRQAGLAARARRGRAARARGRARCAWARSTRSCATASAPGFATDASTASRTQLHALGTPGLRRPAGRAVRRAAGRAARGARHRRRARHAAPRVVAGRAAAVRPGGGPAGGAGRGRLRGARAA